MHLQKQWVPYTSVEVTTPILIETKSWAAILFRYVKRLTESKVVLESQFIFTGHRVQYHWVVPVHWLIAESLVGGDPRMFPVSPFSRLLMLFSPNSDFSRRLANVLFSTGTVIAVDSFLLFWVFLWRALGTDDVA